MSLPSGSKTVKRTYVSMASGDVNKDGICLIEAVAQPVFKGALAAIPAATAIMRAAKNLAA